MVRAVLKAWLIGLLFIVFAGTAMAADVSDYHARAEAALRHVTQLRRIEESFEEPGQMAQQIIAEVRRLVPPSETIDAQASTVETRNGWLHDGLDLLEQADDSESRINQIYAIEERLSALDQQLGQLQGAVAADGTKDANKRKLAEILRRPEYHPPHEKGESLFQRWIREFTDWLARIFPRVPVLPGTSAGPGTIRLGLQILLFVVVIGLVGFLVFRFAPMISFRGWGREKGDEDSRVILGERISTDISGSDLFGQAEEMARQGNVRGAIRKGYIALLCELSDRKLVRLALHKTNRDYLRDVKAHHTLFDKVFGLTGSFERTWYGLSSVSAEEWEDFRARYRETVQKAGNSG